jgi:hypothetical protein
MAASSTPLTLIRGRLIDIGGVYTKTPDCLQSGAIF